MSKDTNTKSRALIFLGISIVFCCITAFICQGIYSGKREEVLNIQKTYLHIIATGAVDSMSLWAADLDALARRVSDSDLYRLFVSEANTLPHESAGTLNDPETGARINEDAAQLAEQVPLMRNVLLDFTKYNGLQDARLVSATGLTLLSALTMPAPLLESQRKTVLEAVQRGRTVFGPVRASTTGLVLDIASPLLPIQADAGNEKAVGALLLSMPATGQIAQFLARASGPSRDVIPWLLQLNGSSWEGVRLQTSKPVTLEAGIPTPDAHGALAFAERLSVGDTGQVYSLGLRVPHLGWTLVQEVPADRVDAALRNASTVIFGIGGLLSAGLLLFLALVWWVMVGREQRSVAQRFEKLYHLIRQQKQLLDSINVSLDVGLFMADVNGIVQVGNRALARIVDRDESALTGQTLGGLLGGQVSGQLQDAIHAVATSRQTHSLEITLNVRQEPRLFRVTLFPFMENDTDPQPSGAVVTLQDITDFRRQSEARRKQQAQTIEALVGAIERVDPYLTGHSRAMSQLAILLAEHMDLSEKDRNTLHTAASLSQMGKIFVPRELLTKAGKLTPEEQAELARVPEYAYNVLRNIDFGMPVPTAILQMYERLDGTGHPNGLSGESISLHGRVLAVLNAFCAMVSPRAFRDSLPTDAALLNLRAQTSAYDTSIVEALAAILATPEGQQIVTQRPSKPQ